jgi:RNA polymerase sigma-70 factor, ECF subfamily
MEEGSSQRIQAGEGVATYQQGTSVNLPGGVASAEDLRMVAAIRAGSESAFTSLVNMYHSALLRLALFFVPSEEVAEEVVQETWLGVLHGLDRFEGAHR